MANVCPVCAKTLRSEEGLLAHVEAKHGREGVHKGARFWENNRSQSGAFTLAPGAQNSFHITSQNYDGHHKAWICPACNRHFPKKRDLVQHVESGTHDVARYHCQGCGAQFKSAAGLRSHTNQSDCGAYTGRLMDVMSNDAREMQSMLLLTDGSAPRQLSAEARLRFDGATIGGNPGTSGGAGWIVHDLIRPERGVIVEGCCAVKDYHYEQVTNNEAEYCALFRGLKAAKKQGIRRLEVEGDSELVIKQMLGEYSVRSENLSSLHNMCKVMVGMFSSVQFRHIYRGDNADADALARQGLYNPTDKRFDLGEGDKF
jgi:ribonuclease HI/uncharacterized C2H2 Zn-finger protein